MLASSRLASPAARLLAPVSATIRLHAAGKVTAVFVWCGCVVLVGVCGHGWLAGAALGVLLAGAVIARGGQLALGSQPSRGPPKRDCSGFKAKKFGSPVK